MNYYSKVMMITMIFKEYKIFIGGFFSMHLKSVMMCAGARTTYPISNRVASADDVHSLTGNGPVCINLFHNKDKDPFRPA